jgi:fatty-acyl-CoA synthase
MSYREVAAASTRLAHGLATLGVRPGDRVGLLMANHPEFVTLKFAIARLGAIAVPFNYLYRRDELRYVLRDSGCRVLITMTGHGQTDYQRLLDEVVPTWERIRFPSADLPELRHVVAVPTGGVPARPGVWTAQSVSTLGTGSPPPAVAPTAASDILYTSGSTGFPKGVVLSHDAVLRTAFASALTRAFEDGRRILFSLPCYHMFGYVEGLLAAMFVGGAVILHTSFDAEAYLRAVARHNGNDVLCVPTMALALLQSPVRHEHDRGSSSWRAMLCGSAAGPLELWTQLADTFGLAEIVTGYGMTEAGGCMTLTLPEDDLTVTAHTVGKPKLAGAAGVPDTDALCTYRTVDPETGEALPAGCEGELVSEGPATMLGYWNRPEQTAETLQDGWVRSGDIGRVRADGYLTVSGRSKELYKSGGELVMPVEIENLLTSCDDISQAYAVGLLDRQWGEIGCVVVVPAEGAVLSADDVLSRCRARLAKFKVPKRVVFRDAAALPITPTGKVQKFKLAAELQQHADEDRPTDTIIEYEIENSVR